MQRPIEALTAALVALFLLAVPAAADPWHFDGVARVVALSDVHGAFGHMVRTLQRARVIDDDLSWSGGETHLVVAGDVLDRGPDSRRAMDLLMRLESEADAAGGRVHVLIGNHEAMNLVGDLRYVSQSEYAAFAAEETPEERDRWFRAFAARRAPADADPDELRAHFDQSFPAGYFAHRDAFAASGRYGAWLLEKPIVIVINGTAYVHGGLSPMVGRIGLDGVNGRLRGELTAYVKLLATLYESEAVLPTDNFYLHRRLLEEFVLPPEADPALAAAIESARRLTGSEVHSPDGPLWYRGNAACGVLIEADRLESVLAAIGAHRVVIGHTPTASRRVLERFGGTVIEVDTGMFADYYAGSGNALVVEGERLVVVNEADPEPVPPEPHPRRVGRRPDGPMSAAEIEALLSAGGIVARGETAAGARQVTVSDGVHSLDAVFTRRRTRGVYPEVAAYRLDAQLGLGMVPVAVVRKLGRVEGSLRFRVPGSIDEATRSQQGYGGAQCPLTDQWEAMMVFDALIRNEGRFARTIRYSPDNWQVLLVGHDRAFGTREGVLPPRGDRELALNGRWRAALRSLTDEVLAARLGDVLDERRIAALARRRDELLTLP